MQRPFVRQDTRTQLEKDLGVREPGLYRSDGQFFPTRKIQMRDYADILAQALRDQGCEVEFRDDGGWRITPPYPEGASRHERRVIDHEWARRMHNMAKEIERNAKRPPDTSKVR